MKTQKFFCKYSQGDLTAKVLVLGSFVLYGNLHYRLKNWRVLKPNSFTFCSIGLHFFSIQTTLIFYPPISFKQIPVSTPMLLPIIPSQNFAHLCITMSPLIILQIHIVSVIMMSTMHTVLVVDKCVHLSLSEIFHNRP